jgi:hypothetical protein
MTDEPLSWITFAQLQDEVIDGRELMHFGDCEWVQMCYGGPVVEVLLTEDPDGGYWGWLATVAEDEPPTMVQPHRGMYDMQFTYGPQVEEERGKGRTVRLTADILTPE